MVFKMPHSRRRCTSLASRYQPTVPSHIDCFRFMRLNFLSWEISKRCSCSCALRPNLFTKSFEQERQRRMMLNVAWSVYLWQCIQIPLPKINSVVHWPYKCLVVLLKWFSTTSDSSGRKDVGWIPTVKLRVQIANNPEKIKLRVGVNFPLCKIVHHIKKDEFQIQEIKTLASYIWEHWHLKCSVVYLFSNVSHISLALS